MKKKPQAKQQGKPVKAGLNFSEKRRLAELKRTLAGNDKANHGTEYDYF